MRPIDVPTRATVAFIQSHLAHLTQPVRLVEVGCGRGEVALALQTIGHDVVAIDLSAEAVTATQELGVDARQVDWLAFNDSPFDAILFTRSLHHLHQLHTALEHARNLLKPGGLILVEDFAFSEVDEATVEWFTHLLTLLQATGMLDLEDHSFVKQFLADDGSPLERWHHDHGHDIHTAATMQAAITDIFDELQAGKAPYLYRYLCPVVPDTEQGATIVAQVRALELASLESRLGRRFVARRG